uniref:Uncharacterized protein n=1 Tax=Xenopus tropicalis TaxID=8364 RepID=A0A803JGG0_XENTR
MWAQIRLMTGLFLGVTTRTKKDRGGDGTPDGGDANPRGKPPRGKKTVFNLSQHILTPGEWSLLSKGLTFIPNQKPDTFDMLVDIHRFQHKLRLKEHFRNTAQGPRSQFKTRSTFEPPNTPATIKSFGKVLSLEAKSASGMTKTHSNLSPTKRQAIRSLKDDNNLVIRPADKGKDIVLLDYSYYKEEILGQLADTHTYRLLPGDPTNKFKRELDTLLLVALNGGWINKDTYQYMISDFPRTPIIYTLPKIHKSLSAPPGRPIISGTFSTWNNSQWGPSGFCTGSNFV